MLRAKLLQFKFITLVVPACAMLLLDVMGLFLEPVVSVDYGHPGEGGIAGYHYSVGDGSRVALMLDAPMAVFDLHDVNEVVYQSLAHTDGRSIRPYENWLHWVAARFYAPLERTQAPARIVAGGGGICNEAAAVLNRIARENGLASRFIGLNGHVVSEIRTSDGWYVADPDYGLVFPHALDVLEGEAMAPLVRRELRARGHDEPTIERYLQFFQTVEDNVTSEINTALSPRLYAFEVVAEYLKWLIPVGLLVVSVVGSPSRGVSRP